ncbi:unnamed protein product [Candidula unifasciata]|uniref:Uncharacterized protein n=1 Tax=Candidula unifasciata TaxID=100452 RepID=A0A8S4AAG6_9EUPU|nr:unnamed protein product [Candidula unifasciata]
MLELLTMFRPFGKWQVLLAICLFDLAFIFVQISNMDLGGSQERRLREVLVQQAEVVESIRETTQILESLYKAALGRAETLESLEKGMDELERQILRIKEHTIGVNVTFL